MQVMVGLENITMNVTELCVVETRKTSFIFKFMMFELNNQYIIQKMLGRLRHMKLN